MRDRNAISAPDTVERRSGTRPIAADARISRDFFGGSIRLHVLHHARQGPVFGVGRMEERAHHGYRLSPGTLYPFLHALDRAGYLAPSDVLVNGRRRRTYRATALGRSALRAARKPILELVRQLFPETIAAPAKSTPRPPTGKPVRASVFPRPPSRKKPAAPHRST